MSGAQLTLDRVLEKARFWAMLRAVRITCPICKTVLENAPDDHEPRPFCSARCKLVDLGNWLNESYRIPTAERPEGNEDEFGPS
jgi:uncharacterized protein